MARRRSYRRPSARDEAPRFTVADLFADLIGGAITRLFSFAAGVIRALWRSASGGPPPAKPAPVPPVAAYVPPVRAAPPPVPTVPAPVATAPPPLPARPQPPAPPVIAVADAVLPYRRKRHLLSPTERRFWNPLWRVVRGRYRVFCNVRLADVVGCPGPRREERRRFGSIKGYHVDFVVCDPQTTEPLIVVELDDRSHRSARRRRTDEYKDRVLSAAGVPVLRVPVQPAYDVEQLRADVDRLIATVRR